MAPNRRMVSNFFPLHSKPAANSGVITLGSFVMSAVLSTILAGVTVFLVGQFFLKLVFEPIISLREALGNVSAFCLSHNSKISNGTCTQEMHDELRKAVAAVIAKHNAIPLYSISRRLFNGPSSENIIDGCRCLNLVGYNMNEDIDNGGKKDCIKIIKGLKEAASLLRIRLYYEEL